MNIAHQLLPLKFIFLMLHLIMQCVALYARSDNIYAGLALGTSSTSSSYKSANSEIQGALISAIVFSSIELILLLVGLTIISHQHNLFHTIQHGVGFQLCVWYVFENWSYSSYWALWTLFCLIPFLMELLTSITIFIGFRKSTFNSKKIE